MIKRDTHAMADENNAPLPVMPENAKAPTSYQ